MKALIVALLTAVPLAASAQGYQPITDRATFLSLVEGRSLDQRLFGVALRVTGDGRIAGDAMGGTVSGSWSWEDGFFCREMMWGDRDFPLNCQRVDLNGDLLRFTADRGQGDDATLRIR
ncbi:dihydrodipicolinate reductase [Loktanella sp. DJP18]|uniref:dihydrodipicolinate reductase n=1 Tax=Loktanella sp. DJP18 TaxID=3409788 RepID=UPI003BB6725A